MTGLENSMQILNDVSSILLSMAVPGEPQTTIKTSAMSIVLSLDTVGSLRDNPVTVAGEDGQTLTKVLPPDISDQGLGTNTVVGAQVGS